MTFNARPAQAEVLKYRGGTLGIAAVPGSGKTHTLSALAADLVERLIKENSSLDEDMPDREVLVVTFSNAAVNNFTARIGGFLKERDLVPGIGYQVCTLHSMALEILQGHTEQLGISDDFVLLDEVSANELLMSAVDKWLEEDERATFDAFISSSFREETRQQKYNEKWRADVFKLAQNVISQAKDYHLTPEDLAAEIEIFSEDPNYPLIAMVSRIYTIYQTKLRAYPAMDFSDLMFNAYRILKAEPNYLRYLQNRWPYILEDEAQDSSRIQEEVLHLLTAKDHNWVRVGDSNQAINETFTTADPQFLKDFLAKEADQVIELKQAGRSSRSILAQANHLIHWVITQHPNPDCREALSKPFVRLTDPGDPQGNPQDEPDRVIYDPRRYTSTDEIDTICRLAAKHVQDNPDETTAILALSNEYGKLMVSKLEEYPVEVVEVLKSTRETRTTADKLAAVLDWLSRPLNIRRCLDLFGMLWNDRSQGEFWLDKDTADMVTSALGDISDPEEFLYPLREESLQAFLAGHDLGCFETQILLRFRYFLKRWLNSRFLPADQLILLIAQDLFTNPDDLAVAGAMGSYLMQTIRMNPKINLESMAEEIRSIARNASLYSLLCGGEKQFDPELYKGKIVVTTYHKAKGLEWDQVFMTTCNTFDFPDGIETKSLLRKAEPGYVRDQLNLQAEALQMLKQIAGLSKDYCSGDGSRAAWINNTKERLRLLYVGITRAKKGLHISWNTGRYNDKSEALSVRILREQWQNRGKEQEK